MSFWNIHKNKKQPTNQIIKKGITYREEFPIFYKSYIRRAALSASMTLEAVFIIPLVVFFTLILIYLINFVNFQNSINETIYNTARTLSKLEYTEEGSANLGTTTALCLAEIKAHAPKQMGIVGGFVGISFLQSDFSGDYIDLRADYVARVPFDFLGIASLRSIQRAYVRKWIGNEDKGEDGIGENDGKDHIVYITETGTVYHVNRNCTYLKLSIQSVDVSSITFLRNQDGGKYYACDVCHGKGETVYITDTGNRYHGNINCSGIKRGIISIPLSQVDGRPACSRCG